MALEGNNTPAELSPWWRRGVLFILVLEFAVLIWIAANTYYSHVGPPIPDRVVDQSGNVIFTGEDILAGQEVFLKHALMNNGTIWGHGAYLGPDFSAEYLHQLALEVSDGLAQQNYNRPATELTAAQQAALKGSVYSFLSENRYDDQARTLLFTAPEVASYHKQISQWEVYFSGSRASRGLSSNTIKDPEELRQLTSFFAWTAWGAAAHIPGKSYSYTNNFPYDPAVGNGPSSEAILWSALSLIALLAGTAIILLAFGRFHYLGWHGTRQLTPPQLLPGRTTASERATLKFFGVVALLLLAQVLVGGAMAHYLADPGGFYGLDLAALFPSNILRSWHLQTAILWIATAYVGGGLFLASALGQQEPKGQVTAINVLFSALALVVFGSLLGEFLGVKQLLGKVWFWFGNQGWEYLEIGRGWQILLAIGLGIWATLLVRAVGPARKDPQQREISWLFLLTAFAIPLFYLPAFFFGSTSNFTVVDTWRFWIIHLWVEGFFELFATVMVAVMFLKLGLVSRQTATRVIYLDAILFLGAGILGTGHHWYWTGQTTISMAIAATFSAMEVVPLILLTLEASDFMGLMRSGTDDRGRPVRFPHKWTFYFLIAVGVWNFIGAGIFGFLINLPVVSYFEAGTNLTPNHGHGALMGVFGMLGMALLVFALRQVATDAHWERMEKYVRVSFWGLNIGLAGMLVLQLFPSGVLQVLDVINNGYWHARSPAFSDQRLITDLAWARLPADITFIVLGVMPLLIATFLTYLHARRPSAEAG
ncbi:MAG: cbb3-type cytochrome c oxidase subunit I [Anaerolineae bacterium]|jgi:nitric oxide reductase subunit B